MTLFRSSDQAFSLEVTRRHMRDLRAHCARAGRHETGGIVVGRCSSDGECATVTGIGAPPADSDAGSTWFVRGVHGIGVWLASLWGEPERTYYLGEWHFHPFAPATASSQDIAQMVDISKESKYRCPEPVLMIVGGDPNGTWDVAAYVVVRGRPVRLARR